MRIGWREYIKRRFKRASKYHSVGIEFGIEELQISTLQLIEGKLNWVKQSKIHITDWANQLKHYVDKHELHNTPCRVTLSIAKYPLLQLDKPAVEESEINQALQWVVKEQLGQDIELAIDHFELPASPANAKKLYVVSLPKDEVKVIRNGILAAELNLEAITIEELSACQLLPKSEEASVFLHQDLGDQINLSIVKNGLLYFSRRLKGYENLSSFSEQELQLGIADNLALEIQRSLDYFESQLRQAPIKRAYVALDSPFQQTIVNLIKREILIDMVLLSPSLAKADSISAKTTHFASLGAALGLSKGSNIS
ncbi:type IV pilus biogenesis protein PilM [Flavobacterium sp. W21_SRS_FM6]|uniref:type IV pilus biogenesis protein PilM n=1 Tax=Flavobacterium sp. W21_SRS_FM6 TaxID=3240268 RepID=UPI003F8DF44D